ncbi:MAG TPA: siderophore-interacting protein [Solirubrobacteraceae bacterium]|nr:siderophore-interacting protein [Solirubrobacteraceae bacterium]
MPTPRTVRVVVQGELADWPEPGPAAHIKVFLPDTPVGPVMRTYTVRDWDRERGAVTIDMALNDGHGPATQWASRVVPGMWMEISGRSRSTFTPAVEGGHYLFAGDETALPAIATCVASLPRSAHATAILEVTGADEEQPLASFAQVDARWLHGTLGDADLAASVLAAVGSLEPSDVWVACEAGVMRGIRRALLDRGFPVGHLTTRGYWRRGESDHPDHDTGEDA